jgi:hypothetical protein
MNPPIERSQFTRECLQGPAAVKEGVASRLLREPLGTRYVNLIEGRGHSVVADDELIDDPHPVERRLGLGDQRPYFAAVDGGAPGNFGDQLVA